MATTKTYAAAGAFGVALEERLTFPLPLCTAASEPLWEIGGDVQAGGYLAQIDVSRPQLRTRIE